jgi:tetratricopeptide (TPR) repeat protein
VEESIVKKKRESMSIRETTARLLASVCALLLLGVSTQSQSLREKSLEQKRFESETTANGSRMADAFYRLGVENLYEPSNSDRAVEHLEKAVELDESNAEYHYMLAEAYMENFQFAGLVRMPFIAPKVKTQLELAVKYDPGSAVYREALVNYYVFAPAVLGGSYQKAHEQANEISKIDSYMGMLAHAGVYAEEGESDKAVNLYKKAIYSRPTSWQAYHHFGNYYLGVHEIDAAIMMFKKYVEVAPDQAESYHQLGQAYQQKRMYDEAIAVFQKALERDPSRTPLVFRIAQLYEFRGNKALAREQYQRYLSMVPSGRAADDARVKIRELGH